MNALETLLFASSYPGVCLPCVSLEAAQTVIALVTAGCGGTRSGAGWLAGPQAAAGHRHGMGWGEASEGSGAEASRDQGLFLLQKAKGTCQGWRSDPGARCWGWGPSTWLLHGVWRNCRETKEQQENFVMADALLLAALGKVNAGHPGVLSGVCF